MSSNASMNFRLLPDVPDMEIYGWDVVDRETSIRWLLRDVPDLEISSCMH